jgi:hypothetical protein
MSANLSDFVMFTGYLNGEALLSHISAFDIGVIPDPYNEANDVMSMNKVFEYCALGIPTASYPLRETKRLLGGAGVLCPDARSGRARRGLPKLVAGRRAAGALLSRGCKAFGRDLRLGPRSQEICRRVRAYAVAPGKRVGQSVA